MLVEPKEMTATQVRANFGASLALARQCGAVRVTRRGQRAAYLLSPATFLVIKGIDDLVARMQKPANIKLMKSLMTVDTRTLREMLSSRK